MLGEDVAVGPEGNAVEFVTGNGGNGEDTPGLAITLLLAKIVGSELDGNGTVGPPVMTDEFVIWKGADTEVTEDRPL